MPKKTTRHNPSNPERRTVQSSASLLQRITGKAAGALPASRTAEQEARLLDELRKLLPGELREHLLQAIEKPAELVLFVDSAGWASRLKLCGTELSRRAGSKLLKVRVMPGGGLRR